MARRNSTGNSIAPTTELSLLPPKLVNLLSTAILYPYSHQKHPHFPLLIEHLEQRLKPLVSVTTNELHPDFPADLLAYHLLTMEQLDNMARHFHQVWPSLPSITREYPVPMRPWIGTPGGENVDLETRRRRFGKFIGLQGCESPVRESFEQWEGEWAAAMAVEDEEQDEVHMIDGQCRDRNESGNGSSGDVEMALDMDMDMEVERMEREWQEGLGREYDSQGHRWGLK